METTIMELQMEKNMESDMDTGIAGFCRGYIGIMENEMETGL